MASFEVVPHGDRWAVRDGDDTRSEHLTREEAVSEARRLGGGAEPRVREDDPTGLDAAQDRDVAERAAPDATPDGVQAAELTREVQPGL